MPSSRLISASLQRNLVRRNPVRASTQIPRRSFQFSSYLSRPRLTPSRIAVQRGFSISIPRRFADVNEDDFDPKSIDRESDQVDVCIVGGGKLLLGMSRDLR